MKFNSIKTYKLGKDCKNQRVLGDFVTSGYKAAIIEEFTHKSATSCAQCLKSTAKKLHLNQVEIFVRKGNVYLRNTNY